MAEITYTAKRSLISGHTLDTEYTLDIEILDPQRKTLVKKFPHQAAGGPVELINHRVEFEWLLDFEPVRGAQRDALLEFLRSTAAAETFSVDIYDSGSPLTLYRVDSGFRQANFMPVGSRVLDWKKISITAREVP